MASHDIRYYIPSFSGLFKSFKSRSKEFLRANTLHGFIYFVNPYRPMWERIIWLISTIASLCTAIGFIVTVWQRFQSTPTLTDLVIETESLTINYPGLNLCMTIEHLNVTGLSENLANVYKTYYAWAWEPLDKTNVTLPLPLSEMFLHITPGCDTLLMDCSDMGTPTDCGKLFIKYLTPVGICCRSSPREFTYDEEPPLLSFILRDTKPLNLYIQDIGDTPRRNSPISYHLNRNISIVLELHVTRAEDGLRMLSQAQRDCVFSDEAPSYNSCYKNCMRKKVFKACGCVLWFETIGEKMRECDLNEYSCFIKNMRKTDCINECYLYCDHTDYVFARIDNSQTRTSISVWWPTVAFVRKTRFGWLDLMVSFGGIMGLFIGYSILTTVELIYYFSLRSYCGAVIDQDRNDNILKIRVAEQQKPKVIEIKYYDYME